MTTRMDRFEQLRERFNERLHSLFQSHMDDLVSELERQQLPREHGTEVGEHMVCAALLELMAASIRWSILLTGKGLLPARRGVAVWIREGFEHAFDDVTRHIPNLDAANPSEPLDTRTTHVHLMLNEQELEQLEQVRGVSTRSECIRSLIRDACKRRALN
jgi:hypothetical protein